LIFFFFSLSKREIERDLREIPLSPPLPKGETEEMGEVTMFDPQV
jgi:hypothetical protein